MNSPTDDKLVVETVVIGGGLAGLTAAVALANADVSTVLVSTSPPPDNRTTALLAGSVTALDSLTVWPRCREHAAPLRTMRIIDDRSGLLRAPEVTFDAEEIGLEAFGYNLENRHLTAGLDSRAAELGSLLRLEGSVQAITIGQRAATVRLGDGRSIDARLVVGADGRNSICRSAAGIGTEFRNYPQAALALSLSHSRPHHSTSTEFHTATGPFTLVPLPGARSSLVWVVDPARAEELVRLDDGALSEEIEQRSHSVVGKIMVEAGRGLFHLSMQNAHSFAANRIALIGEAAHVIPPIGAQGLNLGLRDAATITELVIKARRNRTDIGSPNLMARYDRLRRIDVQTRSAAVDLLNRSLLSDFLPLHGLHGLGLYLLQRIGPLRRTIMREGVTPRTGEPRLMRGEAL